MTPIPLIMEIKATQEEEDATMAAAAVVMVGLAFPVSQTFRAEKETYQVRSVLLVSLKVVVVVVVVVQILETLHVKNGLGVAC
jgi:hypothetical protein